MVDVTTSDTVQRIGRSQYVVLLMLELIRKREDQVFLLTQSPGLLPYQLLCSVSLLSWYNHDWRSKFTPWRMCASNLLWSWGSGEALLGLSSSVIGNNSLLWFLLSHCGFKLFCANPWCSWLSLQLRTVLPVRVGCAFSSTAIVRSLLATLHA